MKDIEDIAGMMATLGAQAKAAAAEMAVAAPEAKQKALHMAADRG